MAESQKRKADDSATEASQFSFQTTYEGDFPPELLKRLDNPPSLPDDGTNYVYAVMDESYDHINEPDCVNMGIFATVSLANQYALDAFHEEHLEFFKGKNWSHFEHSAGPSRDGIVSWHFMKFGGLELSGEPDTSEYDGPNFSKVYVKRYPLQTEVPSTRRQQEMLKRQRTDEASESD